jgi:Flp pilus assembly protein TadB
MWIITACVLAATILIADSASKMTTLLALEIFIGFIVPCWKFVSQSRKRLLRGGWDIPNSASMYLEYELHNGKKHD